ncbi:GMP synthase [glutamine-hydrolyzing] [Candidatus Providencia siddallii]|uniref:GMP synthase [glutamine-hydrolyzing] n=1 Tax=Candidatus Providencia siddallii TaxID=1715285 RepID=A0A0M6W8U1_9GAMM|nr:GMP synthase [glutamine-hydrolyzing] [Candidatus Providencia siddallii]
MTTNLYKNCILVIDFGSQYSQLIVRRIREIGVYCEFYDWNITEKQIKKINPNGLILSGGPESVTKFDSPKAPNCIFNIGVPILGICYGMQTITIQLGGEVDVSDKREFGYANVEIFGRCDLFDTLLDNFNLNGIPVLDVWMSHGDKVIKIPPGFRCIASTLNCQYAIIVNDEKKIYCVQFHPEVTHTRQGINILERFVKKICYCDSFWVPTLIIDDIIFRLKKQIGYDHVLLAFSGGLDSSVVALLLDRAIGKQLTCIFIDNGLLRLNESQKIIEKFSEKFNLNIICVKAEKRFLNALIGVIDPEEKRKKIGNIFIKIFDEISIKIPNAKWLAQGTIYSDIIESAVFKTSKADIIKSHHNVGGLPVKMKLCLVEPLKDLFKDEVKKIGMRLGLSDDILYQHPFPGPGLAVRILGEVKKEYCELLRRADQIFIDELYKADLYYKISQAFAVFLPVRSVAVMGDSRKYDWVISLRAVKTIDFMTANWVELPYNFLKLVSNRIINEINGISRVVYDISGKPPSTIEWE